MVFTHGFKNKISGYLLKKYPAFVIKRDSDYESVQNELFSEIHASSPFLEENVSSALDLHLNQLNRK